MKTTLLMVLAVTAFAGRAQAQRGVDAHLYQPTVDGFGLFSVERAQTAPKWGWGFNLSLDFARNPLSLALYDADLQMPRRQVLMEWQAAVHLGAYLGLTDWLELAFDLPVAAMSYTPAYGSYGSAADPLINRTGFYSTGSLTNIPPPDGAPLDLRIAFKARFFRKHGFAVGTVMGLTLPFGDDSAFAGDSNTTFRPSFIADFNRGALTIAANLGAIVRQETTVYDPYDVAAKVKSPRVLIGIGDELTWGAGVGYRFVHWAEVLAEVYGYVPLVGATRDITADVVGGFRFYANKRVAITLAAGADVVPSAYRHDDFRVIAGLAWLPPLGRTQMGGSDVDGDQIPDSADLCPNEPEDEDGFEDQDGCPDPDNDQDGISDRRDRRPLEAEDRDGFHDEDGCPETDNDDDGLPDVQDKCPNDPEDRDGFQDDDGCPDVDNDGDGIPDAADRCPNEGEVRNGIDDDDGCPDSGGRVATGNPAEPMSISDSIVFDPNQSQVPKALVAALAKLADRLNANPHVKLVRIEGHAEAGERKPTELAQARAEAIRNLLMHRGVDPTRLQAVGYGASRPLVKGRSPRNRSVEFIVVNQ